MAAAQPHLVTLGTLGLHTVAELWRQPRAGVNRRFGGVLLADIDRACGDVGDPRIGVLPPPEFDSRVELFTRAEDAAALLVGATVLLHRLTAWAAARHGRIGAFELRLHHESRLRSRGGTLPSAPGIAPCHRMAQAKMLSSAITSLALNLGEPVSDAAHLQTLLRERLQRVPLAAPVLELSLHCSALVAGAPPNLELFPSAASAAEEWQRLLERFEARLGAQRLRCLEIVADHRPERATRERPASACGTSAPGPLALPSGSDDDVLREGAPGTWPRQRRPAWLLPEPQPLREAGGTPLLAGRPLWLVAGPERIEAGWWDEHFAARDYFIAQAEDGALLWVYRFRLPPSANESGWYLQGWFG
jgi:protein ImuB